MQCMNLVHGSHSDWKPGKTGEYFLVGEFCQDWKNQGILLKILENCKKLHKIEKEILKKSGKFMSQ